MRVTGLVYAFLVTVAVAALSPTSNSNVAVYWGQNSAQGQDTQKPLAEYCEDESADIILLSFLYIYFGTGGLPVIDFSSACSDGTPFPRTGLLSCPTMAQDIKTCQSKGKTILLSLGGASGSYGFDSGSQGTEFADTLWNLFLGGSSDTRPFGTAILDGFDLDTEAGSDVGYTEFVDRLREHFDGASKPYYISAAPQCVLPDAYLNTVITHAKVDFLFVQFYNNYCGMQAWTSGNGNPTFNYDKWDALVKDSPNPNAKIFLGTLASQSAGGSGFVPLDTVVQAASYLQQNYQSFGGVMMWDASQAWSNVDSATGLNFAAGVKAGLTGGSSSPSGQSSAALSASSAASVSASSQIPSSSSAAGWSEVSASSAYAPVLVSSSAAVASSAPVVTSSSLVYSPAAPSSSAADSMAEDLTSSQNPATSSTISYDDGMWHPSSSVGQTVTTSDKLSSTSAYVQTVSSPGLAAVSEPTSTLSTAVLSQGSLPGANSGAPLTLTTSIQISSASASTPSSPKAQKITVTSVPPQETTLGVSTLHQLVTGSNEIFNLVTADSPAPTSSNADLAAEVVASVQPGFDTLAVVAAPSSGGLGQPYTGNSLKTVFTTLEPNTRMETVNGPDHTTVVTVNEPGPSVAKTVIATPAPQH